ncbi:MAG: hydrogenase maturation protease [Candidatus Competibacterales bacterium]|nr:hydrogenase maturation protease [Candidatus Competibacterales bacterium]
MTPTLIVGLGNPWRGDDGAGPALIRWLRRRPLPAGVGLREQPADVLALLGAWEGWPRVILVDAMRSGASPGTLRRCDPVRPLLGEGFRHASNHRLGLADTLELARVLGRLPPLLEIHAIEGADFDSRAGLSRPVARAVVRLGRSLREELLAA